MRKNIGVSLAGAGLMCTWLGVAIVEQLDLWLRGASVSGLGLGLMLLGTAVLERRL